MSPMLATLVDRPFHRPGWVYEEKYDGVRILAYKEGRRVTLLSRNAKDKTGTFAEVARAVGSLRPHAGRPPRGSYLASAAVVCEVAR